MKIIKFSLTIVHKYHIIMGETNYKISAKDLTFKCGFFLRWFSIVICAYESIFAAIIVIMKIQTN